MPSPEKRGDGEEEGLEWLSGYLGWRAYRTREPGPYWPLKGKAHTTCNAVEAAVAVAVAVALAVGVGPSRLTSVASNAVEIEGSAGIVKQMCARIAAKRWSARIIYLRLRPQASELPSCCGRSRDQGRLRETEERPWPSWDKFS